ncbi:MAG TPA: hypothetical protein VMU48_15685 [Terracidiphilus sp.]|nr:hypothetical protein [Terracidiphilus sp.]
MKRAIGIAISTALLAMGAARATAQGAPASAEPAQLVESGHIVVDGRQTAYVIHRLPTDSFPQLPEQVAAVLNERGCMVPQTYEAHRPENVIHASLERAGSSDWAALCSAKGTVSLMVFFGTALETPMVLATAPETERLQPHDPSGVLGFNWGIDRASPEQVHEAQAGMDQRPAPPGHDALADSRIEHRTIYHFYTKGAWTLLEMPDQ